MKTRTSLRTERRRLLPDAQRARGFGGSEGSKQFFASPVPEEQRRAATA